MFTDVRSRRLVLVAHCILNQNSISDGTADWPACVREVVHPLLEADIGIIQMPCPELNCLGLDRGDILGAERPLLVENSRIRESMKRLPAARTLQLLVRSVEYQVCEYLRHGFAILGVVGINRSPSCGVDTTSMDNLEVEGQGVFIEALHKGLEGRDIRTDWIGIKAAETEQTRRSIQEFLDRHRTGS